MTLSMKDIPSCVRPSNFSANPLSGDSVALDWTENSGATQWELEFGFNGFVFGTGTRKITSNKTGHIGYAYFRY